MACLGALLTAMLATTLGAVDIGTDDWWRPWQQWRAGDDSALMGSAHVLWHIRVPRVLLALLVGSALGLSGALTQGLFRNPLADPGLLGVSSGAACATALSLVLFAGWSSAPLPSAWRVQALPVVAFVGALAVCLAMDGLARWLTPGSIAGLLLTGLAINAVAGSVIGLATYLATDEQLRSLSFWTLGSVANASWAVVGSMAALLAMATALALKLTRSLNALALGDAVAAHVGIDLRRLRWGVIALVALTCGAAVAWCGMIGFVGLLAPHLARQWIGPDQRTLLPQAMVLGAWLLLCADTLARTLAIPAEIPVGIFTALLGGPVLILMLRGLARRHGDMA
ncbi:MAG: iron ABC transporter permease [Rubrivivax sp.]|nr:MAG: iron ABC transporter permease [Rubrivivax sp.]